MNGIVNKRAIRASGPETKDDPIIIKEDNIGITYTIRKRMFIYANEIKRLFSVFVLARLKSPQHSFTSSNITCMISINIRSFTCLPPINQISHCFFIYVFIIKLLFSIDQPFYYFDYENHKCHRRYLFY